MTINSLRLELEALISEDSGLGKLLYSNFSGGFWYWDIDQPNNVFCEDRFWLKLGFDPQQIEDHHKTLKSVVSGSEWEILVSQLKEIDHNEGIFPENIIRVQNKKENDLWFICRGFTVNQENQLPPRALFQLVDVSRLKRRELEATSVLSSYRALVDAKSLFYIKTDLEGNYTYANKCFLDHYGYDWKELAGNSSLITIHPDDHLKTFQIVEKCFQIPNTPHPVVIRKPYSDGRVKAERFEFYGVTDEEGNMLEIACVGTSVSDLLEKTAEVQKLLEVQTDKNQRLQQHSYITSHNIRNSVANIKGLLDVMESHPEGKENYMKMLNTSVESLDGTIHTLSKLMNEQKTAEYSQLETITVVDVINRILEIESIIIENKAVKIIINIDSHQEIKTIPAYFESIFHNLISNALKYGMGASDSALELNWSESEGSHSLEVKDYGEGFDLENNADFLFRMGTRLSRETLGSGLGLFITKHHVRLIGAEIIVTSSKGKGASFKVTWND